MIKVSNSPSGCDWSSFLKYLKGGVDGSVERVALV